MIRMDPWLYDPAPDLDQSVLDRLRHFPRQPDMLVYGLRLGAAAMMRLWLRTYHRLRIVGGDHLPRDGSFILVANHASHLDTLAILSSLPYRTLHRVFPAAARDYFFVNVPRLLVAAVVVNALPFDREVNVRQSLRLCAALLDNPGNVLLLFPEGTRTTTGRLGELNPVIGLLLAGRTVPVVPCHIEGAFAAWPKGRLIPRPRRVTVRFGPARSYAHLKRGKAAAASIGRDLHDAITALADPDR